MEGFFADDLNRQFISCCRQCPHGERHRLKQCNRIYRVGEPSCQPKPTILKYRLRHCPYALYFLKDPTLWQYFLINSKAMNIEWCPHGPNEYELVILRKNPEDSEDQACFYTFPELSEWSTKDIFEPHPTLPDYWLYKGSY